MISGSSRSPVFDSVLRPAVRPLLRSPLVPPQRRAVANLSLVIGTPFGTNNGTTGTPGKPAALATDMLLLFICSTSQPSPPNASWTLVASQTDPNSTQRLDIYSAPGTAAGGAVTQATAGTLDCVIMRVRGLHNGTLQIGVIGSSSLQTTNNPEPMQSITPTNAGMVIAVGGCSGFTASTSVILSPSSGWTSFFSAAQFRWRLALAAQNCKGGVPTSGSFSSNGYNAGTGVTWNKIAFVVKEV